MCFVLLLKPRLALHTTLEKPFRSSSPVSAMTMDDKNKALCFYYRHPPKDSAVKPVPFRKIRCLVWNKDGKTHPNASSVHRAVAGWRLQKAQRGRKVGWRKTTPAEDGQILKTFHKVRPPGFGVTSTKVCDHLRRPLRVKVCKRTIRNRLKDSGFVPEEKTGKAELRDKTVKARVVWCDEHKHRTGPQWSQFLQGCADFKSYSFYPRRLKLRFFRYNAKWTYMSKAEKKQSAFARPGHASFTKKEKKSVRKGKIFGMTLSTGAMLVCHVESPFKARDFAKLVRQKIGPFFKQHFPEKSSYQLLLDGEPLMHAPEAKEALKEVGTGWP